MSQKDYVGFAKHTLGVVFKDIGLLQTALTHRSWVNEARRSKGIEHNERLEFLGDAVLELVTTEFLYSHYDEAEGIMTNWRSALVRTESIGDAAEKLGFFEMMRMSRGEKSASARARQQMLANAYEAIVGAIYCDQGYDAAQQFIEKTVLVTLDGILKTGSWQDAKSRLQELSQAKEGHTPTYKVLSEKGPDHDKVFTVGVYVGDDLRGQGDGPSKQTAQQAAAEKALDHYGA
ncbi:TPA: ribonuclease III [Candidatus Saccharibacteria bacterium]|nr:ribonuclease III [Candidatus Saccharibacteria bacterium]HIO87503.1 ribonuclease III [Candidatus Saccharibacteria bacterium]